jgi:segregation and condensation protein A
LSEVPDRESLSKPPLNILLNPEAIRRQKPWDLNVESLLEKFLYMINKSELINLRLCGSAIVSSALIYRLKVETFFLFEKLRVERKTIRSMEPPFFEMPFRHELYSTSLEELISALERILKELSTEQRKEKHESLIEPEPLLEVDKFSLQIKELLSSFRSSLLDILERRGEIFFSEYVHGMELLKSIQSFILLLFVATEGLVTLEQVGEDIRVKREVRYLIQ